jgi:hypothetical protein
MITKMRKRTILCNNGLLKIADSENWYKKKIMNFECNLDSQKRFWTRWTLWTSKVLNKSLAPTYRFWSRSYKNYIITISEVKRNKIKIRSRSDQSSMQVKHLSEVKDQQRGVGKRSRNLIQWSPLDSTDKENK